MILIGLGIVAVFIFVVVFLKWWRGRAAPDEDEEIGHRPLEENTVYLQHLELQMIRRIREESEVVENVYQDPEEFDSRG